MKKLSMLLAAAFLLGTVAGRAESLPPIPPIPEGNPFALFDKKIEKLGKDKDKEKDKKKKDKIDEDIKKEEDKKDKKLSSFVEPREKKREYLLNQIDTAKEKNKDADTTQQQAQADNLDKEINYLNDLAAGKNPEPLKKGGAAATPAQDGKNPADAADKAKKALQGDLGK